jgi:hypothetical protein
MLMQKMDGKMIMNVHQIIRQRVVGGFHFDKYPTLSFYSLSEFCAKFQDFPESCLNPNSKKHINLILLIFFHN